MPSGRLLFDGVLWLFLLVSACVPARAATPPVTAAVCGGCHGMDGVSPNPVAPTLAGQPYTLIEDNLLAFRAGKRSCSPARADGSSAAILAQTMCEQVRALSDQEISGLAEYYSGLAFVAAAQEFDPAQSGRGAELHARLGCERCHADGGRETYGMAPVLAGQWTPFLRRTLGAIRNGLRSGPKMMNPPIRDLDDQEIEALLNFYASRQGDAP